MLVVTLASAINAWPATQAVMPTEIPLAIQILGAIGVGLVALVITSSLAGLALGAQPARLAGSSTLPDRDALLLGGAAGAFGAALLAAGRVAADARHGPKPSTSPRWERSCRCWPWRSIRSPAF